VPYSGIVAGQNNGNKVLENGNEVVYEAIRGSQGVKAKNVLPGLTAVFILNGPAASCSRNARSSHGRPRT
jgi:hypothetical protein